MLKTILLTIFVPILAISQEVKIALYTGKIPNSIVSENITQAGESQNVSMPELWYFPAPSTNGTCVIICPGGGYMMLASKHEGSDVAKKFNEFGVTVFVLKYRLPNDKTQIDKSITPLQDAQQAIRIIRNRAAEFGINPKKIGIMGFSAGGHLASTAGTHFEKTIGELADTSNVRPDFMILGYPVITMKDFGHRGSKESLIGKTPSQEVQDYFSNELQVSKNTPPTFLFHAADDRVVPVQNSLVFYEALLKNKVPAEMHLYPKGGHGFGMKNPTHPDMWMERVRNWLVSMGLL